MLFGNKSIIKIIKIFINNFENKNFEKSIFNLNI